MSIDELAERRLNPDIERANRNCGLIVAADMPAFMVHAPEEESRQLFDTLCLDSDGGWINFRGGVWLLDHRMENGNEIRSIIKIREQTVESAALETTNLILHRDNKYYLESHVAPIGPGGELSEPAAGSSDVVPSEQGTAMVLFYQVAYEAVPLRQVA